MVGRIETADAFFAGGRELERNAELIEERLRLILEVRQGERPLLPSFGCRVHELPAIEAPHERRVAEVFIEEALRDWAPWAGVRRAKLLAAEAGMIRVRLEGRAPVMEITFGLQEPPGLEGENQHER